MCGIVAYTGKGRALPVLVKGIERMEYRGHESGGIALAVPGKELLVIKAVGNCDSFKQKLEHEIPNYLSSFESDSGIGHGRWATHGTSKDVRNAHPHLSPSGDIAVVHNGMIENYRALRALLEQRGYVFKSDTDTEVIPILVEDIMQNAKVDFVPAICLALMEITGAYGLAFMHREYPGLIVVAKKSSPVSIGITDGYSEYFIASGHEAIVEYTSQVINLEDDQIATLLPGKRPIISNIYSDTMIVPYVEEIEMDLGEIEKGGYDYFMKKEIHEQPDTLINTMRGRIHPEIPRVALGGIQEQIPLILRARRVIFLACGTSYHAGMIGKYLLEKFARIICEVETASEFRYRDPVLDARDVVIGISQSGETADTNGALLLAKQKGALVLGICNVVGSEMSRITTAGIYTHAGVEIGVASTKAFSAQVAVLAMLGLALGDAKGTITKSQLAEYLIELSKMPDYVRGMLLEDEQIKILAGKYATSKNFLYMGRDYGFPLALEGALKLKEISYIHAEGLPAAEIKHGVIALIDKEMPTVIIATKGNSSYEKVLSTMEQIKARDGRIIAICTEGDTRVKVLADHCLEIPRMPDFLIPIAAAIPLQLLAYHIAVLLGKNVDQPRNLAKSVTVE